MQNETESLGTHHCEKCGLFLSRTKLHGKRTTVVQTTAAGIPYVIGAHLAARLEKETYNLYRGMKTHRVPLVCATRRQIRCLIELEGILRPSTRSVTFVPLSHASRFICYARIKTKPNAPRTYAKYLSGVAKGDYPAFRYTEAGARLRKIHHRPFSKSSLLTSYPPFGLLHLATLPPLPPPSSPLLVLSLAAECHRRQAEFSSS